VIVETAEQLFDAPTPLRTVVDEMRALSFRALARMYVADERMFCFTVRRGPDGDIPEGVSRRYTAIVLIGLAAQQSIRETDVLGGESCDTVCRRLLSDVDRVDNLGDVALTLWASVALKHEAADRALQRLIELDPLRRAHPTVEIAWALSALTVTPNMSAQRELYDGLARRLLDSFNATSGLFPHWPANSAPAPWRDHVTCFADWVYPVHALSNHHIATGADDSLDAANRSAEAMLQLQGTEGQWWWHYDVRTGEVIEPYPVYSVHQDSMAPMALFALQDANNKEAGPAVRKSLEWLIKSPERGDSLIDHDADLIWRKVCRREPGKLTRGLQALTSRACPPLRMPGVNLMFPPRAVDYECRPYHLGWLLYAFSDRRLAWS